MCLHEGQAQGCQEEHCWVQERQAYGELILPPLKANFSYLPLILTQAPADGALGSQVQCDDCWGFYKKGVNKAEFGCPCAIAQAAAIKFAAQERSAPKIVIEGAATMSKTYTRCAVYY